MYLVPRAFEHIFHPVGWEFEQPNFQKGMLRVVTMFQIDQYINAQLYLTGTIQYLKCNFYFYYSW